MFSLLWSISSGSCGELAVQPTINVLDFLHFLGMTSASQVLIAQLNVSRPDVLFYVSARPLVICQLHIQTLLLPSSPSALSGDFCWLSSPYKLIQGCSISSPRDLMRDISSSSQVKVHFNRRSNTVMQYHAVGKWIACHTKQGISEVRITTAAMECLTKPDRPDLASQP